MRNALIAVVVVLVLAGGYFLISNKSQTPTTTSPTPEVSTNSQTTESPSPTATNAMKEDSSKETNITLTQSGFAPQTVTIKAGEKVVWTNNSGDVATVNSSKHPTHQDYPPLNLGQFQDGQKLELVFDKPGTYMYHDHLHPTRFGKIVVE
jgi:plastocyanin